MRVYFAAVDLDKVHQEIDTSQMYALVSFAYLKKDTKLPIDKYKDILLDSGAFTFAFSNAKVNLAKIDWKKYIEDYAECIRLNNIKHFMELDIDRLVGYGKVKELRQYLETLVGRPCIPVWHTNRGLKDYQEMVKKYKYVAIGGIRQEVGRKRYKYFKLFLDEAHKNGCRVHGLGFTRLNDLLCIPFDSVDSTTYLNGAKFFEGHRFNGRSIIKNDLIIKQKILNESNSYKRTMVNLKEWYEYSKYAERCIGWKPNEQW